MISVALNERLNQQVWYFWNHLFMVSFCFEGNLCSHHLSWPRHDQLDVRYPSFVVLDSAHSNSYSGQLVPKDFCLVSSFAHLIKSFWIYLWQHQFSFFISFWTIRINFGNSLLPDSLFYSVHELQSVQRCWSSSNSCKAHFLSWFIKKLPGLVIKTATTGSGPNVQVPQPHELAREALRRGQAG
jgi:hypothetical protein